jgi:cobalamin biosynthesis protein CobC
MKLLEGAIAVVDHGGSLGRASALFPHAPQPFVDLSTGINPHSYPLFELPATALSRLPEAARVRELANVAASAYGAPSAANVAAAPGTQILLPRVASLVSPGKALVLGPTYAEHRRAAAIAGHVAAEVDEFEALAGTDLAIVVNPNNPDGRLVAAADLHALAAVLGKHGGVLIIDEAFADFLEPSASAVPDTAESGVVVLRSLGKTYGLPGLRLGFAIASKPVAEKLRAALGPWPVSGAAIAIGSTALSDAEWLAATRARLHADARALDKMLATAGFASAGGSLLFRLVRHEDAQGWFERLAKAGIFVRRFAARPAWLRFGIAGSDAGSMRLCAALGLKS